MLSVVNISSPDSERTMAHFPRLCRAHTPRPCTGTAAASFYRHGLAGARREAAHAGLQRLVVDVDGALRGAQAFLSPED